MALATILVAATVALILAGPSSGSVYRGGYRDPLGGNSPVNVTVDPVIVERHIPRGFLGISLEYWALENYAGQDPKAVNPVLVQLIRNVVRGGMLRIGGVTTDMTWWPVSGVARPTPINYALSRRRLEVAKALAEATDSRLIMGIQFEADSSRMARAEALAMLKYIGSRRLAAFELGNEPEFFGNPNFPWYTAHGHPVAARPPGYDLGAFTRDFARIGAALPRGVPLAGPSSNVGQWVSDLGTFIRRARRVGMVTLHRYPFQACLTSAASPVYPTIGRMLSPAGSTEQASGIAPFVTLAHASHLPVSIDEMNSVSCGDPPAVSDSFAQALWVIDALFADAAVGVDSVEVHTWPGAIYRLFRVSHGRGGWNASVSPEYYGLLLFAQAAPPGSSLVHSSSDSEEIRAWATRGPGRAIRIALINDDTTHTHEISVRVPGATGSAAVLLLRAPTATARRGVTLGDQSFGTETGTGVLGGPRRTIRIIAKRGAYSLRLRAASAALLTLR